MTESGAVLRELYASEINARFQSIWDGGVHWRVGDEYNGYVASGCAEDWDSAIYEMAEAASAHFEHSGFNAWWWSGARSNYWPKPDAKSREGDEGNPVSSAGLPSSEKQPNSTARTDAT